MPKKTVIINYKKCDPDRCPDGKCLAISRCEKKLIKQLDPHEPPIIDSELCIGCYKCIEHCNARAIEKVK